MNKLMCVYDTHALMKKWVGHFRSGRESADDDAWADRQATVCNIEKLKWRIEKDRWKMIRDVADGADISHTSVYKILWQNLEMEKVCLKLVLKVLAPEQKKEWVFIAVTFLNDCEADPTLLRQIIIGDKSWVFEYDPSTKCQSMQWKGSDEPPHKKACMERSQQKLMLILFFDV